MKREGWQHGGVLMVRSPSLRLTDHSAATAGDAPGFYAKAPSRPSSHSKHTGKCRRPRCTECHSLPVSKSRNKAKGAYKLRSCDVALNHRLVSWRVVDDGQWQKLGCASASDLLRQLSGYCWNDEDDGEDEVEEHEDQFHQSVDYDVQGCSDGKEDEEDLKENDDGDMGDGKGDEEDLKEHDDGDMGFCEVGFIMKYLEGEDWCMVDEI